MANGVSKFISDAPGLAIGVAIFALVAGIIVPVGLEPLADANITGLSANAQTIWDLMPLLVLVVLAIFILKVVADESDDF